MWQLFIKIKGYIITSKYLLLGNPGWQSASRGFLVAHRTRTTASFLHFYDRIGRTLLGICIKRRASEDSLYTTRSL